VGSPLTGRALVIDDVITAGTAVRESAALVSANGAKLAGIVIALDREHASASHTDHAHREHASTTRTAARAGARPNARPMITPLPSHTHTRTGEECGTGSELTAIGQVRQEFDVPVVAIVTLAQLIDFLEDSK